MRKVLQWYSSKAQSCKPFQEKAPVGFPWFRSAPGATLASADRTPLKSQQLPGWREYSERTHSDRSWDGRPRPSQLSFPTPCHWFPGQVTLVTLSFNLLQRAWPTEHISRGREQTLGATTGAQKEIITFSMAFSRNSLPQKHCWIWDLSCFHIVRKGSQKSRSTQNRYKESKLQCAEIAEMRCQSRLTYCFRSGNGNGRVCRCRHKHAIGERN